MFKEQLYVVTDIYIIYTQQCSLLTNTVLVHKGLKYTGKKV